MVEEEYLIVNPKGIVLREICIAVELTGRPTIREVSPL